MNYDYMCTIDLQHLKCKNYKKPNMMLRNYIDAAAQSMIL